MTETDRTAAEHAIGYLLRLLGEDSDREGLRNTPARVVRSLQEMTAGRAEDPAAILATQFDVKTDEIVMVTGIRFTSLCEHHLLPFVGTAAVGYLPGDRVVGLSKIPRLVECFARRLQVQERLTQQIAATMEEHLKPLGVAVVLRAHHACMGCRGVRQPDAIMTTSAMLGCFRTESAARAEFLTLIAQPSL